MGSITSGCSRDKKEEEARAQSLTPEIKEKSDEQSVDAINSAVAIEEEGEYLTGVKLFTTSFSMTLIGFLMLLDVSVVSTVSFLSLSIIAARLIVALWLIHI